MSKKLKLTSEQIAFLRLVKKTIQEEIRQQLDEVVEQVAQKILSEVQAPTKRTKDKTVPSLSEAAGSPRASNTQWNSGNPLLDSVMAETTPSPNFRAKYGSLMNGVGTEHLLEDGPVVGVTADTPGVDDTLKEALTRDYSELMKAIQKDQRRKGIK